MMTKAIDRYDVHQRPTPIHRPRSGNPSKLKTSHSDLSSESICFHRRMRHVWCPRQQFLPE